MTRTEKLEEELEIAKLVDEYESLRPKVEDKDNQKPKDMERYHELNQQISEARAAFKEKYPPDAPVGGDAAAEPEPVSAKTK